MGQWKLPIIMLSEMVSTRSDSTNGYIAWFILGHMSEIKNYTIRDLAEKANVSASSISRFCRDIGLSDFNELKILSSSYKMPFQTTVQSGNAAAIETEYIDAVETSLEMVRKSVDPALLDALCRDIRKYERVAVFGIMKSAGVAMSLQADMALHGKQVVTRIPFSEQIKYIRQANENDLIIIFAFRGTYFNYYISDRPLISAERRPKIYFITSGKRPDDLTSSDIVIHFDSLKNNASHPYQLQLIAGLISEHYYHLINNPCE